MAEALIQTVPHENPLGTERTAKATSATPPSRTTAPTAAAIHANLVRSGDGRRDSKRRSRAHTSAVVRAIASGAAQTTGRDYSAQGDAYHQVITGPLNAVVRSFGETCLTVSGGLTANQQNYEGADASGSTALRSAGGDGR